MTAKFFGNNQNLFLAIARNNFAVAEKHFLGHEKFFVTTKKHFFRTRKIEKVFLRPRKLWLASGLQKIIARILFFLISFRDRKNNISLSQEIIFLCLRERIFWDCEKVFFNIAKSFFANVKHYLAIAKRFLSQRSEFCCKLMKWKRKMKKW